MGRWIPLIDSIGFDDWNLTGVDSLATDPVDPARVYVLAGTYTNEWTPQNGRWASAWSSIQIATVCSTRVRAAATVCGGAPTSG